MEVVSTYSVKIKNHNKVFSETVKVYRNAVDFYITVILNEWTDFSELKFTTEACNLSESLSVVTKRRPFVKYDLSKHFYKLPAYLRRAAISEAYGKVCSYKSNLANWEAEELKKRGKKPSYPVAGRIYPTLYKDRCFVRTGEYTARVKVYIRNTWDWLPVELKKSDVDYITRHCGLREECVPTLQKRGKQWFLDFPFKEKVTLTNTVVSEQTVVAVDLGINNACACSIMRSDGTILGRKFLSLPREQDSLNHAINRLKKAQQHGNYKTPRLQAKVNGINDRIAVLTAQFIVDTAILFNADVIVFEHLDRSGKLRGSKKQRLHLWKSQYVQEMVTNKAHRCGMRISHINAWGTSKLAFDGSGKVLRGKDAGLKSYSECRFADGKVYNCDLSASYNIGARYFIRELLKSLPKTARLDIEAKVPQCSKRSTCTLSTLISLNAVLAA